MERQFYEAIFIRGICRDAIFCVSTANGLKRSIWIVEEGKAAVAKQLTIDGMPIEKVCKITGLSLEILRRLSSG